MPGITVGIDGSKYAHYALEWALHEAALRNAPLTVLAVNPVMVSMWTGQPVHFPADDEVLAKVRKAAEEAVAEATAKLGDERPPAVTVTAVSGLVVRELLAASQAADMVVLGSRGSGGFDPLRLGSVSSQVTHHAQCPVVIVPHTR